MKTFNIDVRVKGFVQVSVEAPNLEAAEDMACEEALKMNVSELRWKEMTCTDLDKDD